MLIEPEVWTEEAVARRDPTDGSPSRLPVFIARPKGGEDVERPALLLIQEAFGVNKHIRDVCCRFARRGYVVVSPDLYYRIGEWQNFAYTDFAATHEARKPLTEEKVVGDLQAALDVIAGMEGVDPERIGVIGYCMGGRLTYVAAAHFPKRVKVGAIYYGGGIVQRQPDSNFPVAPIERTSQIKAPIIGFFGGKDRAIPQEDVEEIDRALAEAGVARQIYFYPEADHGFFCDARASFHSRAAEDAWHKTVNKFAEVLKPAIPEGWE